MEDGRLDRVEVVCDRSDQVVFIKTSEGGGGGGEEKESCEKAAEGHLVSDDRI